MFGLWIKDNQASFRPGPVTSIAGGPDSNLIYPDSNRVDTFSYNATLNHIDRSYQGDI